MQCARLATVNTIADAVPTACGVDFSELARKNWKKRVFDVIIARHLLDVAPSPFVLKIFKHEYGNRFPSVRTSEWRLAQHQTVEKELLAKGATPPPRPLQLDSDIDGSSTVAVQRVLVPPD